MDASQYKDYVLVLLFIKYVSDKYAGMRYAPIAIPPGASFKDMVALKGKPDIGDQINKKIIHPLASANNLADMPDFNDATKLGSGKDMVDRLTNLIAIFENKALDFSKNRADGDDILGDAYEYLMRHFATESGKSKGQFYTPAEVSRVMAKIVGIRGAATSTTTVYDPTCGSGSLLLKVGDEASATVTLYGQEKDAATAGLARMNMILHNAATADIRQGNTLANPFFKEGVSLKTFDYVVANPPFSDKRWGNGIDPPNDPYGRFNQFGTPPARQGDYAYLLHIVRSLKSNGKGACILPHGVLFRGNAEADIRRNLIRKGYIAGIIGLPPNLFYGTGIPACIVVIDKEDAHTRKGIFIVDASAGFLKDGNKNRLRAMDIHKIVDVFNRRLEIPKYSRMVGVEEIEKNDFNLNIPRYIDSSQPEDIQDIEGHLRGGIPAADIDALERYWSVCPQLRRALFRENRPGYLDLAVEKTAIKPTIYQHPEFVAFTKGMNALFSKWRKSTAVKLKALKPGFHPKALIVELSEDLLAHYAGKPLIDQYDVYQHLMDYWAGTMQDDCYLIAADGWKAETTRLLVKNKNGKELDKGWTCDLVPKSLIVARYFAAEQAAITALEAELEGIAAEITDMEEEHGGDEGVFAELDKVNRANVAARLKEARGDENTEDEAALLYAWLKLSDRDAALERSIKEGEADLDAKAYAKYPTLTEAEIQTLVVDDKWFNDLEAAIHGEMNRISQVLAARVMELFERYEVPMPALVARVADLEQAANRHIERVLKDLLNVKKRQLGSGGRHKTEIGDLPIAWRVAEIGEIADVKTGPFGSSLHERDYVEEGTPIITVEHLGERGVIHARLPMVSQSDRERLSAYSLAEGDIVFSRVGSVDRNARISNAEHGWLFSGRLLRLRLLDDAVDPGYLSYQFHSEPFKQRVRTVAVGQTMASLNTQILKGVRVALPENQEQTAIADVLSEMDTAIAALEAKLAKIRQIKQGMMQNLLTGRTRLE
jgi:type I restriction enzyme M protein